MQMVKARGAALLFAAILACACGLAGCAGVLSIQQTEAAGGAQAERSHTPVIIGEQLGATQGIVLTNEMGTPINGVSLHTANSKGDPVSLNQVRTWAKGEDAIIFIPVTNVTSPSDIILTTEAGEYVIHDIEFPAFAVGEVHLKGKVAYLSFIPGGSALNTLEHERYLIAKAEAKKKAKEAKAATKRAEKAEAAAKAATEEAERARTDADAQVQAAWAQAQQAQTYYYEETAPETTAEAQSAAEGNAANTQTRE